MSGLFKKLFGGYDELCKAIIRPPRDEYEPEQLGPSRFQLDNTIIQRTDLQLTNGLGLKLQCSFFEPDADLRPAQRLPCVVYLHGNCSSRVEALPAVPLLLQFSIWVFTLDLSGSGMSEGEYISLGWYERDDLQYVVQYLRSTERVSTIGLWGRSMGAVTALLHGDRDPSIAGMVLDSAFTDLKVLAKEIAKQKVKVPSFILSTALSFLRKTVMKKARFDINDLTPLSHVDATFIPAMFAWATDDDFILPWHTKALYDAYAGDKQFVNFEGDHNSTRPAYFYEQVTAFFISTLRTDMDEHYSPPQMSAEMSEAEAIRLAIEESLKQSS